MKRVTYCSTAVAVAFLMLFFVTGSTIYSAPASDTGPLRPWYGFTRVVTITVDSSSDPLTPALNSLWQMENINQVVPNDVYRVPLPTDAYSINVKLLSGVYTIDPDPLGPTVVITTVQPWFYIDYRTNQRAVRIGGQILITQTAINNQEYRYISTVNFTGPYQYIGTSGYSPASVAAATLHWDTIPVPLGDKNPYRFYASTWLGDPRLTDRPDLEILTATLHALSLNQVQVTAVIQNRGITTTVAPSYLNLYDYLAPSTPPTNPADATYSWCSRYPSTQCPPSTTNPLPLLEPGASVTFTADYTLSYRSGLHDLYFLVDGLGGNLGLNWESNEDNNWILAGSKFNSTVLLPVIQRY
jgi:hypothetical protein